jgi:tetrahydromethanopterin S-methyltransferase subunit E
MEDPDQIEADGNGFPKAVFLIPAVLFAVIIYFGSSRPIGESLPSPLLFGAVVLLLFWLGSIYDVLSERRMASMDKILWIIVLLVLNLIGTFFYLLLKDRYVLRVER